MRLVTQFGSIELPEDFSFEVERTNPFLSDEGDATIPATIPASQRNLNVLENIDRVDKAFKFIKKVPAILQHGVFCKHGQLVIDTVNRKNGIAVSFAIENSDVYSQYKNKSLKEITKNKVRRDWQTMDELITHMNQVAFSNLYLSPDIPDYDVFPVAIAKYEDEKGNIIYQFNNEVRDLSKGLQSVQLHDLVSEARTVHEADYVMSVPQGYGIAPFIYLHKAIDVVFEEIGYQVVENCFNVYPLDRIVLLNNSSDMIVKCEIPYADMMPSCTLADFIEFLKNKFCVALRVDSSSKKVWVELMQDLLSIKHCDIDISNIVDGELDMIIDESSRVVLSSDTSMEGSEPAAENFDDLINRYGCFVEIGEEEFSNIGTQEQNVFDCLVKRKLTGVFYELRRNFKTGKQFASRLGTDNFKYDRVNSENIEEFEVRDVIPPLVNYEGAFYLYIGDRVHHHTSFNNKQESDDQNIMICWSIKKNWGSWYEPRGRLSKYQENPMSAVMPFSLNTYDMYDYFWSKYNNLLLNNKVTVRGRVAYSDKQLASLDMVTPKYYKGQILLPESMSYNLGNNKGSNESQFILIREFLDQINDVPLTPTQAPLLKWNKKGGTQITSQWWEFWNQFPIYFGDNGFMGSGQNYIPTEPYAWMVVCYDIEIVMTGDTDIYLGPPTFEGQESIRYNVNYQLKAKYTYVNGTGSPTSYGMSQIEDMISSMESHYHGMDLVYFKAIPV